MQGFIWTLCVLSATCFTMLNGRECHPKLDLVFVVDSSSSVGTRNFRKTIAFIRRMTSRLPVGPESIRVGILRYAKTSDVITYLNQDMDKASKLKAIQGMEYTHGPTLTHQAFKKVREDLLTAQNGDRPGIPDLVLLITDGISVNPTSTFKEAEKLKQKPGLKLRAIGVGSFVSEEELQTIASSPEMVDIVLTFGRLTLLEAHLVKKTCLVGHSEDTATTTSVTTVIPTTTTTAMAVTTTPNTTISTLLNDTTTTHRPTTRIAPSTTVRQSQSSTSTTTQTAETIVSTRPSAPTSIVTTPSIVTTIKTTITTSEHMLETSTEAVQLSTGHRELVPFVRSPDEIKETSSIFNADQRTKSAETSSASAEISAASAVVTSSLNLTTSSLLPSSNDSIDNVTRSLGIKDILHRYYNLNDTEVSNINSSSTASDSEEDGSGTITEQDLYMIAGLAAGAVVTLAVGGLLYALVHRKKVLNNEVPSDHNDKNAEMRRIKSGDNDIMLYTS